VKTLVDSHSLFFIPCVNMPRTKIIGEILPSGVGNKFARMDKSSIGKKHPIQFDTDSEEDGIDGEEEKVHPGDDDNEADEPEGTDESFNIINTAGKKKYVPKHSFHHTPPEPLVFQPVRMLRNYGIGFGSMDDIDISKANLAKQIEYWERGPTEKPHFVINSIKTNLEEKAPYGKINWRDKGPMIGVYKRRGTTAGQCVWMNLAEAQVAAKLGIKILDKKGIEKETSQILGDSAFTWDYNSVAFQPRDFVKLGVPTDFVIEEPWGNAPNADAVAKKMCAQN
jgi:hypothetical protein